MQYLSGTLTPLTIAVGIGSDNRTLSDFGIPRGNIPCRIQHQR
jgi:hypothetical protein